MALGRLDLFHGRRSASTLGDWGDSYATTKIPDDLFCLSPRSTVTSPHEMPDDLFLFFRLSHRTSKEYWIIFEYYWGARFPFQTILGRTLAINIYKMLKFGEGSNSLSKNWRSPRFPGIPVNGLFSQSCGTVFSSLCWIATLLNIRIHSWVNYIIKALYTVLIIMFV